MMVDRKMSESVFYGIDIAVIVLGLYLSGLCSYLLPHALVGIVTMIIAFSCFILAWNTRACRKKASGLPAAEVIGVPHTDIPKVPGPAVDEYIKKSRQALKTGDPRTAEFSRINAEGGELEEQVTERPAEPGGKNREPERKDQMFVGRGPEMAELKNRIRELENGAQ